MARPRMKKAETTIRKRNTERYLCLKREDKLTILSNLPSTNKEKARRKALRENELMEKVRKENDELNKGRTWKNNQWI
tara:strand:+ start:515 stop:748 length:234 start_codon:yes stop_codon:yes gene_type:complete